MTEEWSPSSAHHSVCTEELCCGTDDAVNPLGKGLEAGAAAFHPESEKLTFFQKRKVMNAFLAGYYLSEPLLCWEQTPSSDF